MMLNTLEIGLLLKKEPLCGDKLCSKALAIMMHCESCQIICGLPANLRFQVVLNFLWTRVTRFVVEDQLLSP